MPRTRNRVAVHPLLRKGGVHQPSDQRQASKRVVEQSLEEWIEETGEHEQSLQTEPESMKPS